MTATVIKTATARSLGDAISTTSGSGRGATQSAQDDRQRADAAIREVLRAQYLGIPALVVPSPPGAGKTDLVEKVAAQEAGLRRQRCLAVTQTNQQAFELVARMRADYPRLPVVLYCRERLAIPDHLITGQLLRVVHQPAQIPNDPCVVVANATKLSQSAVPLGAFSLMIVDEAWQLPNYLFLSIAGLALRVLLVGDPGQIAPVVRGDITRWLSDPAGPHVPAPQALLATHPETPVIALPVSRRLVDDTARIVQRTFYPGLPFGALVRAAERRVEFRTLAATAYVDPVLTAIETGHTLAFAELPAGHPSTSDEEVAATIARIVHRFVERGAHLVTPLGATPIGAERIGVVCAHRAQVRAVRARLAPGLARHVLVETANRFQGLERDLMVAWHPLTGRSSVHDFHVDAGRFCVMLSRHRAACVIVGRAGIGTLLDRYTPGEPPPLGVDNDPEFDGWSAHRAILDVLRTPGRTVSVRGTI